METGSVQNGISVPAKAKQAVFRKVERNLYRLEPDGCYYALIRVGELQIRKSLKTLDIDEARCRLADLIRGLELRKQLDELLPQLNPWLDVSLDYLLKRKRSAHGSTETDAAPIE